MKVLAYERALDLEMGELKRYALIETAQGKSGSHYLSCC